MDAPRGIATDEDFRLWWELGKSLEFYCVCRKYPKSCRYHVKQAITEGPHNFPVVWLDLAKPTRMIRLDEQYVDLVYTRKQLWETAEQLHAVREYTQALRETLVAVVNAHDLTPLRMLKLAQEHGSDMYALIVLVAAVRGLVGIDDN
jgi:hypothetical protein